MPRNSRGRRMALVAAAIALLAVAPAITAPAMQPGKAADTVRGLVQMKLKSGSLVAWESVRVSLISPGTGGNTVGETFTDTGGMYYFRQVPPGTYVIQIETPSRQRQKFDVAIRAGVVHDVPPIVLGQTRDYIDAYRDGVRAMDLKNWAVASQLMKEAVTLQAGPPVRQVRVYGVRVEPYAPNYFLAAALVELHRCADAAKPLSLAAGEVKGTSLESDFARLKARCL